MTRDGSLVVEQFTLKAPLQILIPPYYDSLLLIKLLTFLFEEIKSFETL